MVATLQTSLPFDAPVKPFHVRFREWRLSRGFKTTTQLADATGLRQPHLSEIERGVRPLSEQNMQILAANERWGLSYETMRVWRLINGLTRSEMAVLARELERIEPQVASA